MLEEPVEIKIPVPYGFLAGKAWGDSENAKTNIIGKNWLEPNK